jgi:hypothetical protein
MKYGTGWTYEAGPVAEDCVGRDSVQSIDDRPEPLDQLRIAIPEFIERLRLLLEYSEDRIWRVASIDGSSQWVIAKILTSALGVLCQSCVEESFEIGY